MEMNISFRTKMPLEEKTEQRVCGCGCECWQLEERRGGKERKNEEKGAADPKMHVQRSQKYRAHSHVVSLTKIQNFAGDTLGQLQEVKR